MSFLVDRLISESHIFTDAEAKFFDACRSNGFTFKHPSEGYVDLNAEEIINPPHSLFENIHGVEYVGGVKEAFDAFDKNLDGISQSGLKAFYKGAIGVSPSYKNDVVEAIDWIEKFKQAVDSQRSKGTNLGELYKVDDGWFFEWVTPTSPLMKEIIVDTRRNGSYALRINGFDIATLVFRGNAYSLYSDTFIVFPVSSGRATVKPGGANATDFYNLTIDTFISLLSNEDSLRKLCLEEVVAVGGSVFYRNLGHYLTCASYEEGNTWEGLIKKVLHSKNLILLSNLFLNPTLPESQMRKILKSANYQLGTVVTDSLLSRKHLSQELLTEILTNPHMSFVEDQSDNMFLREEVPGATFFKLFVGADDRWYITKLAKKHHTRFVELLNRDCGFEIEVDLPTELLVDWVFAVFREELEKEGELL